MQGASRARLGHHPIFAGQQALGAGVLNLAHEHLALGRDDRGDHGLVDGVAQGVAEAAKGRFLEDRRQHHRRNRQPDQNPGGGQPDQAPRQRPAGSPEPAAPLALSR